eukprot:c16236_g1_i1.p1 GENE.c16236_g1_i1~~c16236_g1_i1.p1  ORF type:complete len:181 (+),score=76.07 c16236_g1_i1:49-591(+)
MGQILSFVFSSRYQNNNKRILMLGLDAAGKTTILHRMKFGNVVQTLPTIGFNVETIKFGRVEFTCWDIGGQKKIRELWKHYYHGTQAIVFVVDSNDVERIEEAGEELRGLLQQDELINATLLVLANKQDLPNAKTPLQIQNLLGLENIKGRKWIVQGCSAPTNDGLQDGFYWLTENLPKC